MNNKGFTLVEVVVVVAILALIGVLVMPNILNSLDTGKKSSDRVLYGDIKEAMQVMYEEKAYSAGNIYSYDNNGKVMDENDESMPVILSGNSISTNIQTLISNGFLTGVNNDDLSVNKNKRIVVNSKGDDLGSCKVKITKTMKGSKVCYVIEGSGDGVCPSTEDFGGNTQCGDAKSTSTVTFYNGSNSIGTQKMDNSTKTTLTSWSSLGGSVLSGYDGWSFVGWATNKSDNTVKYKNGQDISITNDTDLYAVYSRVLTVNYNANGGSGNIDATTKNIYINSNSTTTSSQEIILKDNFFIYDGYVFDKWTIGSDDYLVNAVYEPNIAYNTLNFGITVYAKWIPNTYKVKYNGNGSTSGSMVDSDYVYGTAKNLATNAFSRTGYYFAGWATRSDGNVVYSNNQSVKNLTTTNGGTVNLYAKWSLNKYTIKYNGNGNTGGSMSNSTHSYGVAKNLTTNGFTKTGHSFSGWATSSGGNVVYSNNQSVKNLTTANGGTVNLYAKWNPDVYSISYDANGGIGAPASQNKIYGSNLILSNIKPTLEGYDFLGWSTSSTATTPTYDAGGIYSSNVATTLYAVWGKNYLVNFSSHLDFSYFRGDTYREKIKNISFVNYIDTTDAVDSWDMSTLQNGGIIAWVEDNETSGYYDLYIGSEKLIKGYDMGYFFMGMTEVDSINFGNLDTSEVIDMNRMFCNTGYNSLIFTLDLGENFDTSNVEYMDLMFNNTGYNSTVFTLDLGEKFDTSSVEYMRLMFNNTGYSSTVFTLDLGEKFDMSNVTDMRQMFFATGYSSTVFTLDLGEKFDTTKVTDMSYMFCKTGYSSTVFTLDLGDKFDTTKVTDMSYMFYFTGYSSTAFTLDLEDKFDTSNVTDMSDMFNRLGYNSTVFTLDLGEKFDTTKVTDMSCMFYEIGDSSTIFMLNLGDKFDTSNVTDMSHMFYFAGHSSEKFMLDLGEKFDTTKVTDMSGMFTGTGYSSTAFTLDLEDKFDTSNVTDMSGMFNKLGYNSTVFTLDLGEKFDTSNVTDMSHMFYFAGHSSEKFMLDLGEKFDTTKVTNMSRMFSGTGHSSTVFTLDLGEKFDTTKVTDMSGMFSSTGYSSTAFTLDLEDKFDTSNVTDMSGMFNRLGYNSTVFTLDLGEKFDTTKVTNMNNMFMYMGNSNTTLLVDLTQFNFDNVSKCAYMFDKFKYTQKIYVKNSSDKAWLLNKGFVGLSKSNVIVK